MMIFFIRYNYLIIVTWNTHKLLIGFIISNVKATLNELLRDYNYRYYRGD